MASVAAKVVGGQSKDITDVETVKDVRLALGLGESYTAVINGEPAQDHETLSDDDYVVFSAAVKGG